MQAPAAPVQVEVEEQGTLLRLTLARPRGNVIDRAMVACLTETIALASAQPELRTILLAGEGPHFSFGASVEEHRPGEVEAMLPELHELVRALLGCGRVVLAAVRGQCLGGGLELALCAHRIFAAPDSALGQPEVKLAVFAPAATVLLPARIGAAAADDLLLTGRSIGAEEAAAIGLVQEVVDDPLEAARGWHRTHLAPLSAAGLRHAVLAGRDALLRRVADELPRLEERYLTELMATCDAREGIAAFLERRAPRWSNT